MKFGKRLSAEAERHWKVFYIDYKALKRAIQADVDGKDALGRAFDTVIRQELQRVAAFYVDKEEELQAVAAQLASASPEVVASFHAEVKALKKYVVLNYICVVKASKKRNRHLKAVCGEGTVSIRANDILAHQYFFTSPKLASIATQAEILSKALQPVTDNLLQDYQCPICLGLLRGPVLLTCAHRFCWGCLLAHCTTTMGRSRSLAGGSSTESLKGDDGKQGLGQAPGATAAAAEQLQPQQRQMYGSEGGSGDSSSLHPVIVPNWEGEGSDDEQTMATFDCPVCRKAQLLDLNRLQVDPPLDAFVRKLELQGQQAAEAAATESSGDSVKPMAVDGEQSQSPPPPPQPVVSGPITSTGVEPISVEAMDAVLEYLHKEHRALEEEKRWRAQQATAGRQSGAALQEGETDKAEGGVTSAAAQRSASQPMAISSSQQQQPRQEAEGMEVDAKPSVRSSGLLAASEDEDAREGALLLQPRAVATVAAAALPRLRLPAAPLAAAAAATAAVPSAPKAAPVPQPEAAAPAGNAQAIQPMPMVVLEEEHAAARFPLLPPQRPEDQGKLTVCLDLDGTLVTTFTPKRAPVLPAAAISYVVGRGTSKLNPGGVFVVERPGLEEFFRRIAPVAEVVLFTAGLEDYAAPICDALQSKYNCFLHRLYRPACQPDEVYPCVKDMSLLGRDLSRTLLVDDTPLAFVRQPDNGIPVLQFRGDIDDRLLSEAVAPLIESLAGAPDVRSLLSKRFNMTRWFHSQGLLLPKPPVAHMPRAPSMPVLSPRKAPAAAAPQRPASAHAHSNASGVEVLHQQHQQQGVLLVCDFDKTILAYDAGERLCDELAPELTSLLSHLEMPANFVPVTNTVLAEMQRRGISRDRILATLRAMGQEVPLASVRMLQWAARSGLDVRILSDCNTVFINHILNGAKVNTCVREVITNFSAFQRVEELAAVGGHSAPQGGWLQRAFGKGSSAAAGPKPASQRLVITPRHPYHDSRHGCPLCPENLCKGQELEALWGANGSQPARTIYCGDGANDLCPALSLGPSDVVLARKGFQLEALIRKRAGAPEGVRRVVAQVRLWETHEELWQMVQEAACC